MGHYFIKIRELNKAKNALVTAWDKLIYLAESDPLIDRIRLGLIELEKILGENNKWRMLVRSQLDSTESLPADSYRRLNALSAALDYALTVEDAGLAEEMLTEYAKSRPDCFDTHCYSVRYALMNKDYAAARSLLEKMNVTAPSEHYTVDSLWETLCVTSGDPEAAVYSRRIFEANREQLMHRLLFMNSSERRNLNGQLRQWRDNTIAYIDVTDDMNEVALEYSLLTKGLLFRTQKELRSFLSELPEAQKEYEEIQQLRHRLNNSETWANDSICNVIRGELASRERYIIDDYMDFDNFRRSIMSSSADKLKATIKPGERYVDFIEYGVGDDSRYGALVISGDPWKVEFVRLCTAASVLEQPANLWGTLEPMMQDADDIYFCTDGRLSGVAIEYATDKTGTPYSDKYRLHRVFDLCDIRPSATLGTRPHAALIGVSDHNSPLVGETRDKFTDLTNVAYEIKLISDRLGHEHTIVLTDDDARESAVKALSGSDISLLHISTHGFYRSRDSLMYAMRHRKHADNTLAHRAFSAGMHEVSGLALRGANDMWLVKNTVDSEDNEDNLLLAEEIEMMEFPQLQLTVLSACDTGLGEVDSEGVWGLQRAFRIAGTRSLICSLTKVDDYWTAQFMDAFYEQAVQGHTIYDSFHAAQRWLRHELPDNPEVWSSFILIE